MGIIGITEDVAGRPIQRLAVTNKVAVGLPPDPKVGRKAPMKLDHFIFQRKAEATRDWEIDEEFTKHYGKDCREFWIVFMDDEIDNIFRTEFAWWTATERKCWGDGRCATRRTERCPQGEPWPGDYEAAPCGFECPDLDEGLCKPTGQLFFIPADFPRLGSAWILRTTSYRSVRQIHSSLQQIKQVFGRLAGIRAKLCVRQEKVVYYDKNEQRHTGTAPGLYLELDAKEFAKLLEQGSEPALLFEKQRKMLGAGTPVEYVIEAEEEDQVAKQMQPEFYPEESAEPKAEPKAEPVKAEPPKPTPAKAAAPPKEEPKITSPQRDRLWAIAKRMGWVKPEVKKMLYETFNIESSTDLLQKDYERTCQILETGQEKIDPED